MKGKTPNKLMKIAGPGTKSVWGGEMGKFPDGATQVPVVNSVTFAYEDLESWFEVAIGKKEGHIYSRNTNPTTKVFEDKICVLEDAESATSFASGMAAISGTLHSLLVPGNRIVSIKDTYGGTSRLFMEFLPGIGIDVKLCDTTDHEQIKKEIKTHCDLRTLKVRRIQP